jgi:NAD(P)-dependent dehydrogenase (short-subunit alcohol dehydrogenase family)
MKRGTQLKYNASKKQSRKPGKESEMLPEPEYISKSYKASGKLNNKVAIITGGDSGIGRAVAVAFALEGANLVIQYLNEHEDAEKTKNLVEQAGRECLLIPGDLRDMRFSKSIVDKTIKKYGKLNIIVNNAADHYSNDNFSDIEESKIIDTFNINVFPLFFITKAALPYLKKGSSIINTASVTAYRGSDHLVDYSSTKGAVVTFTRSLSKQLIKKGIYVNAVAPGPIWTPLIVSTFTREEIKKFGTNTPMGRAGQPSEVSPCFVFLASDDSSYMSGQVLHPNGGEIING